MIFLGGSCGASDWRRTVAIPQLQSAGIAYFDPQLGDGEWRAELHEARDQDAKNRAEILLFVIEGSTRAVASLAEAAYLIALGRPLALAVADVPPGAIFDGRTIDERERADLNRGRTFVRTMAREHEVACFADAGAAVEHAISLARRPPLDFGQLSAILAQVECGEMRFVAEEIAGALQISVERGGQTGRRWLVDTGATPSEVVQTALKAALTWEEHEARERFRYRGRSVFGPHIDVEALASIVRK